MDMAPSRYEKLSRREREIMDLVYRKGTATVGEVRKGLADPPSYSAVRATLRILEASLIAETPCTYLVFPRTAYHRLAEDYPRTACRLSESIFEELAGVLREGLDKIATCE